jgi:uncharacterized protein
MSGSTEVLERAARVVLRPIGNPLPLGFLALAAGTVLLSALQFGWLPTRDGRDVAIILVAFVVPLQLLAAIFGFLARDVVAGTGMGVLSGTWLSIGLVRLTSEPGTTSDPLGVLLLMSAICMLVPAAASASGKLVPMAVLLTTSLRFATAAAFELTADETWKGATAGVGLALAAIALYAAAAMAIEDAKRQTVLPLGRRGAGAQSIDGNFQEQLQRIEREAGVREQL